MSKLREKLEQWAKEEYLPLLKNMEMLKMENELLTFSVEKLNNRICQLINENKGLKEDMLRYRDMCTRYQSEIKRLKSLLEKERVLHGRK